MPWLSAPEQTSLAHLSSSQPLSYDCVLEFAPFAAAMGGLTTETMTVAGLTTESAIWGIHGLLSRRDDLPTSMQVYRC
jgi:hypothetical protein